MKRMTPLTRFAARIILATTVVDRAYGVVHGGYRLFDRLRSELISALASDAVLDRFNELAYARTWRRPDAADAHAYLFPWEQSVVDEFFPRPPARVLVGGAGGGREAFVLAKMGFEVVAFEPSRPLAEAMATHAPQGANVDVRLGRYEDIDALFGEDAASYGAAVLGWGSFSYLRNAGARLATLKAFKHLTRGPILVSFVVPEGPISGTLTRFRRFLPRRAERDVKATFSVDVGFYHGIDESEMRSLARQAGLEIVKSSFDATGDDPTRPPYVVLVA